MEVQSSAASSGERYVLPSFRVFGPTTAHRGHETMELGGPRARAIVAVLLAAGGRTVSVNALVDAVWRDHPPRSAKRTVHSYIARLRRALDGDTGLPSVVVTHGHAYALVVPDANVDARRFEDAARRGRELLDRHDAVGAASVFEHALGEWHGPPYEGHEDVESCAAAARALEELRRVVVEDRFDAMLQLGSSSELVPLLTAAIDADPLRERLWGQLMLALYRSGRQADALRAYQRARAVLISDVGVEPGPALREIEGAILAQDDTRLLRTGHSEPTVSLPSALDIASSALFGRDDHLRRLHGLWRTTLGGTGQMVSVVGVEGVGKTRLVAELASAAHHDGGVVAFARCDADHRSARALLDQALRSAGGSLMRAQADAGPGEPIGTSVARRLSSWATRRPVLVVLDDLHEAEAEVLEVVAEIATAAAGAAVLLVVVFRVEPGELMPRAERAQQIAVRGVDRAATAGICALYGDAWNTDEIDQIHHASGGVPRSVHEQAVAAARGASARRLDEAASQAETAGFRLATSQQAVRDEVIGIRRVTAEGRRQLATRAIGITTCPFRGLMPFETEDAEWFFGRERTIAQVVARLVTQQALLVVGPSGSGKSSLVRAGVVPALADGILAGSERWQAVMLTPGANPVGALTEALQRVDGTTRTVLVVDQFEELFTLCTAADERAEFARSLADLVARGAALIAVIRADQIGGIAQTDPLAGLLEGHDVLVGPISERELRDAIVRPAELAGLQFEDGLVDEIVADARGSAGVLPFVQTALLETWVRRTGNVLTLTGYSQSGGVRGAIARMAEDMHASLTEPQQLAAWRILLRLADASDDGTLDLRRRVPIVDVARRDDADAWVAFDRMVQQRLLTVTGQTVEVTHETLLREWPRLRRWLEDDVEGRRLHQRLGEAAHAWVNSGRDTSELLRGARLAAADEWARRHGAELNDIEHELLDASRAGEEHELREAVARADREERSSRRLRRILAGAGVLLVIAIVAGAGAFWQRHRAEGSARRARGAELVAEQRGRIADAGRLSAQALVDQRIDRALLTAVAAVRVADTPDTRTGLLNVIQRAPFALGFKRLSDARPQAVAVSPDGELLVVTDNTGRAIVFDADSFDQLIELDGVTGWGTDWTRAGHLAYGAMVDGQGAVQVVDPSRPGAEPTVYRWVGMSAGPGDVGIDDDHDRVVAAAWTPAGTGLAVWDLNEPAEPSLEITLPYEPQEQAIHFLPDGSILVATWGRAIAVDPTTGQELWAIDDVHSIAVSPDGNLIALAPMVPEGGSQANRTAVSIYDIAAGQVVRTLQTTSPVTTLTFTEDGARLLLGTEERGMEIWDPARVRLGYLSGHANVVRGVAASPDGALAYSVGLDGTLAKWDLTGRAGIFRRHDVPTPESEHVVDAIKEIADIGTSMRANGDVLYAYGPTVAVRDGGTGTISGGIETHPDAWIYSAAWAPDGQRFATASGDGSVRLFDRSTSAVLATWIDPFQRESGWVGFDHDGRTIVVGLGGLAPGGVLIDSEQVVLLDADTLDELAWLDVGGLGTRFIASAHFDPGGSRLLVQTGWGLPDDDGRTPVAFLVMLDLAERRELWRIDPGGGTAFALSADGSSILLGGGDGRVEIIDAATGRTLVGPVTSHDGWSTSVRFSADGRLVVSSGTDGIVRVMQAADLTAVAVLDPLWGNGPSGREGVTFLGDGSELVLANLDQVWVVPTELSDLIDHACEVAGRELTEQEWSQLLPDRSYERVCSTTAEP